MIIKQSSELGITQYHLHAPVQATQALCHVQTYCRIVMAGV